MATERNGRTARRRCPRPRSAGKGSKGHWRQEVPASMAIAKRVFVTCHYCSYSPRQVPADVICPKCGGHSWERYALPVAFLPDTAR